MSSGRIDCGLEEKEKDTDGRAEKRHTAMFLCEASVNSVLTGKIT